MASDNSTSSFPIIVFINDSSPAATTTFNNEQLKSTFKFAILDDIDRKKGSEVKESVDKIKMLLSKRIDLYTVAAHGVTKTHSAAWWLKFSFAKEVVSGESYSISNFVSCQNCFSTYRYGISSTESITRHQCDTATSSSASTSNNNQSTLDVHFNKNKKQFRVSEQKKSY
ncbi:unnamed protein product [Rotaria sp. Silwood1]|nr:unnamed protein product [Rotaria sp. Silwood1]CAF4890799.1 unnamed protein product [Rotaria sp. Silwood1]